MFDAHASQGGFGALVVFGQGMMIGENASATEESREHNIKARRIASASRKEIRRDDAKQRPQFKNIPDRTAEDGHGHIWLIERITFAGYGLDQCGFARAVWTEDADMLPRRNAKGKTIEGKIAATDDGDILKVEESGGRRHR
jgi:hypothetical protein